MRRKIVRRPAAVAVFLGLTLAFSGCSGADEEVSDAANEVETSATAEEEPTEESETTEAAAAADATEVEIGETWEDPEMDDTIEVLSAVRDFPSEAEAEVIAEGGEVVLLQVKITPGQEYGGRVAGDHFEISWDDGEDFWNNKTRMVADEMEAAGHTVLEDISRRDGGEHTGWIAFLVDEKADTYLVEYSRSAAKVIGSDKEIEEFSEQAEIPAA